MEHSKEYQRWFKIYKKSVDLTHNILSYGSMFLDPKEFDKPYYKGIKLLKGVKPVGFKKPRDKNNNVWRKLQKKIHENKKK